MTPQPTDPARAVEPKPGPRLGVHLLVLLLMVAGAWLYLFPADLSQLTDSLVPDLGDPLFNLSIMKWGASRLPSLEGFWHAPFFYPHPWSTARSDHMLGPAVWLGLTDDLGGAVLSFNLLFLLSFILSGFTTYWVLSRRLSTFASALAGFWYAYSPYRFGELSHVQILLAQWIPLTLWAFDRLLERPSARRGAPFLVFYGLHIAAGAYLTLMIHVALLALAVNRFRDIRNAIAVRRSAITLGVIAAIAVLLMTALYGPYVVAGDDVVSHRGTAELRAEQASALSVVTPGARYRAAGLWPPSWRYSKAGLFPGLAASILAGIGLASVLRWRRDKWRRLAPWQRVGVFSGAAICVLAIAVADYSTLTGWEGRLTPDLPGYSLPFLLWTVGIMVLLALWARTRFVPIRLENEPAWVRGWLWMGMVSALLCLPFLYAYHLSWLPGFGIIRATGRFFGLASLAIALLMAAGVDALARVVRMKRLTLVFCAAFLLLELRPDPVKWKFVGTASHLPGVYRVLAEQNDRGPIVELPFREEIHGEAMRMYRQTFHQHPLINGYSGSFPGEYLDLREQCTGYLPDPPCMQRLRHLGVNYVLSEPEAMHRHVLAELARFGRRDDVEVVFRGQRWLFRLIQRRNAP